MQQTAALVQEAAGIQGQVSVGGFQSSIAVIERTAELEIGFAATAQRAQLPALVVDTGACHAQGAIAFNHTSAVDQRATSAQLNRATCNLPGAVVQLCTTDSHQAGGIHPAVGIGEVVGIDHCIAGLRSDEAVLVVEAVGSQVQAMGLECATLVIEVTADAQAQAGLALHLALGVIQSHCVQLHVGVLAIDQAVVSILHDAGAGDRDTILTGKGAAATVVQATGEQRQQALADDSALGVVVDLHRPLQQQWAGTGNAAAAVVEGAEQVEGQATVGGQRAAVVVQVGAGDGHRLLGVDRALVGQCYRLQIQRGAAFDQTAIGVGQRTGHDKRLPIATGKYAFATVIQAGGTDAQAALANQRAFVVVLQRAAQAHIDCTAAAGERAVVTVVEVATTDVQALPAGQQASGGVVHGVRVDSQHLAADQLAGAVVQVARRQSEALQAGDFTALVIKVAQVFQGQRAVSQQQTVAVVQITVVEVQGHSLLTHNATARQGQSVEVRGQHTFGRDLTAVAGVEAGGVEIQGLLGTDQALVLVVQQAITGQLQVAAAIQSAASVVDGACVSVEAGGADQAFEVGQGLIDAQGQALITQQLAVAVIQTLRGQGKGLGAGDFTVLIIDAVEVVKRQRANSVDQSALVLQLAVVQVETQASVAEQLTALLIQPGDAGGQRLGAADAAAVGQLCGGQGQGVAAVEAAGLVVQLARADRDRAFAADDALLVAKIGALQCQAAVGDQFAFAVIEAVGDRDAQTVGAGQAAFAVIQAAGFDGQCVFAAKYTLAVIEITGEIQLQRLLAEQLAAVVVQHGAGQRQALAVEFAEGAVDDLIDCKA